MSKVILGTGSYLPEWCIDNDELESMVLDFDRVRSGSSLHEWAMKRAGVAERHRVRSGEGNVHLATNAARRALDNAGLAPEDIDLLVLSTFTSDYRLPSTVSLFQAELGITAKCFQLEAACAGFIDATITASALMDTGRYHRALVVHTEVMSSLTDPERFLEQTVFGDGSGAVVLANLPDSDYGIKASTTHTDGSIAHYTWVPMGGTLAPITAEVLRDRSQYTRLRHKEIYDLAVEKFVEVTREVVALADASIDDIDWWIPHQTGQNIIDDASRGLGIPSERVQVCIDHTGNTSGATVPIALDEANRRGDLAHGSRLVLSAVGGGMAWGALYLVWADPATLRAEVA